MKPDVIIKMFDEKIEVTSNNINTADIKIKGDEVIKYLDNLIETFKTNTYVGTKGISKR